MHAEAFDVSSVHVTFNTAEEAEALESCGWLKRIGMQFHWWVWGAGCDELDGAGRHALPSVTRAERIHCRNVVK